MILPLFFAGVFGTGFFLLLFFVIKREQPPIAIILNGFQRPRRTEKASLKGFLQALWGVDGDLLSLGLCAALGGFVAGYMLANLQAGVLLALFAFVLLPRCWSAFLSRRRAVSFRDQLPEIIETMSSVLQAGGTETKAIEGAIEAARPPVQDIFRVLRGDMQANTPIGTVMDRLSAMVGIAEVRILADALKCAGSIGHEASILLLDEAAEFCRERARLRQKIYAATSDIRYGFLIVSFFPPAMAIFMALAIPQYRAVFMLPQGRVLIAACLALLLLGHIWVNVLLKSGEKELGIK